VRSDSSRPPRAGIENFDSLLAEVQAGRAAAWDRCYRWLAPAVAGYLRVQGAADVEDLTSEVFLAMFRNIDSFSGTEANFRSWVFVIAHRRLQDERRRRFRRFNHDETLDESLAEHVGDPAGASTEEEALRTMGTARVDALCARLAPDQRDVVLLRVIGDLSVDQVAEALDKSPGAVKQLQRRGFEALRRLVDREGVSL
jgi:RNA polymerase sigma-70 factor (ECF subfamily)